VPKDRPKWSSPGPRHDTDASSTRTEWSASEFQAELAQFSHALRAAGLKEATIHSYLTGSSRFVRWLAGDYVPGRGRAAPSARANRAPEPGLSDRNAAIVLARERGDTLQGIATRFGISRERARQILAD